MAELISQFVMSFMGTFAAIAAWTWLFPARGPCGGEGAPSPIASTPRSRTIALVTAAAFAVVVTLLLYLVSSGEMAAGLAAVAAVVALLVLVYVARALR